MSIEIEPETLERVCKGMIETILYCLHKAYKGTIYRIGSPPDLIAQRITSGRIDRKREKISWGLPAESEYNKPGKPWLDYRDEQGKPLEAMGWCVERQKSWTAQQPSDDPDTAVAARVGRSGCALDRDRALRQRLLAHDHRV